MSFLVPIICKIQYFKEKIVDYLWEMIFNHKLTDKAFFIKKYLLCISNTIEVNKVISWYWLVTKIYLVHIFWIITYLSFTFFSYS